MTVQPPVYAAAHDQEGEGARMRTVSPAFEPAECMFEVPPGVVEGEDVVCGYIRVPLEHAKPDGPTIRLAAAVIKSRSDERQADPLFVAQGGPGGSTIDTYASILLGGSILRSSRDIVLFDQRGTLYSQPALICTEIDQLTLDTIEKDLPDEEYLRLEMEAMRACRQRLQEQGIDLSAFDSLENAADIDSVRQALGYDQINLYGVSYGTLLALHTLRSHSEMLRSVILDGVVPPSINFIPNVPHTMNGSFERLFAECAADAACGRAYPRLRQVFYELVDGFNAEPARISLTDPDSQITYQAVLDGDTFQSALFQMLYAGSLIPGLPRMIYDAQEGRYEFLAHILSILVFDRTMSYGMYYSVLCAEDADFDPAQQDLSGLPAQIAAAETGDAAEFLQVCQDWQVQPLDPWVDDPVVSDIPTLLLSGAFDPITPASYAEEAARTLSNSFSYVFPAGGHGQMLDGGCGDHMILAFLDDPHSPPEAACEALGGMPPVRYYTPQNTIDLPLVFRLLNLDRELGLQFLALLLSLSCLLTAVPVYGAAWAVRRLRPVPARPISAYGPPAVRPAPLPISPAPHGAAGEMLLASEGMPADIPRALDGAQGEIVPTPHRPADGERSRPSPLSRRAYLLPILGSIIAPVFICGLFILVIEMVARNDNRLFFGVAREANGWFLLPWLFVFLTLGMLAVALYRWVKGRGGLWGRLYFSLLTLAALVCAFLLFNWGMLAAVFY